VGKEIKTWPKPYRAVMEYSAGFDANDRLRRCFDLILRAAVKVQERRVSEECAAHEEVITVPDTQIHGEHLPSESNGHRECDTEVSVEESPAEVGEIRSTPEADCLPSNRPWGEEVNHEP
jgi:hypothetical protein